MHKLFKQVLILICLVAVLILPYFVFAQTGPLDRLKSVGGKGGYETMNVSETTLSETLGTIVNAFLGLLGVIFIILMILAGYNWMTSAGDEEKLKKAKSTIRRAIIGLVITVSAYAIWQYIFVRFVFGSSTMG